ncbi:nucleotidyltransferase family protein [Thalassospira mesophila]|uniref:MobA-like NTP transferase domain-containing protein n=1 Tax=Thalassospira mesophila TaxID=1293891 RepID=A0A1Y2KVN2_9PROT|nr:nucleotidyltransferase family protein [Thalassospira mesophila]OSQ35954.1 hypothetical protein TMES_19140 [Thalassospira mesophila]
MANIACLLLAAGQARRFGDVKQIQTVDGTALIRIVYDRLAGIFGTDLYVVLGANATQVAPALPPLPANHIIYNQDWASGMGASIAAGIKSLQHLNYDAIMIALADQIAITTDDYAGLIDKLDDKTIICARYNDRCGAPAIFPAQHFEYLAKLNNDAGARDLLKQETGVIAVPVPSAAIDIDTMDDLDRWKAQHSVT